MTVVVSGAAQDKHVDGASGTACWKALDAASACRCMSAGVSIIDVTFELRATCRIEDFAT